MAQNNVKVFKPKFAGMNTKNLRNLIKEGQKFSKRQLKKAMAKDNKLAKAEIKAGKSAAQMKHETIRTALRNTSANISEAIAGLTGTKVTGNYANQAANIAKQETAAITQNVNGGITGGNDENKSSGFGDFGASGRDED